MSSVFEEMAGLDRLIHEPARLAVLTALSYCEKADFLFLQRLTGLSAGSFVLSTLAFVFGIEKYKPIGKIGVVLAALFLIMAPLALLIHVGQPFKAWHLFVHLNVTSPITWGSFLLTLYPINCLVYGWFMFKGNKAMTKLFGTIGIPLAVFVHGYTGFILALGKARALWNTALMPFLFLVSAMVSV